MLLAINLNWKLLFLGLKASHSVVHLYLHVAQVNALVCCVHHNEKEKENNIFACSLPPP